MERQIMTEKPEIKVTRTYSLSPAVVAWVTQRALQLSITGNGQERISDSKVVNDILTAAMDKELKKAESLPIPTQSKQPKKSRQERTAVAA
jgi:hypothetical protein